MKTEETFQPFSASFNGNSWIWRDGHPPSAGVCKSLHTIPLDVCKTIAILVLACKSGRQVIRLWAIEHKATRVSRQEYTCGEQIRKALWEVNARLS
jgi:hypothetical protein